MRSILLMFKGWLPRRMNDRERQWECAACGKLYRGDHAHLISEDDQGGRQDIACCGFCCVRVRAMVEEERGFDEHMRLKEGIAP